MSAAKRGARSVSRGLVLGALVFGYLGVRTWARELAPVAFGLALLLVMLAVLVELTVRLPSPWRAEDDEWFADLELDEARSSWAREEAREL